MSKPPPPETENKNKKQQPTSPPSMDKNKKSYGALKLSEIRPGTLRKEIEEPARPYGKAAPSKNEKPENPPIAKPRPWGTPPPDRR